LEILSKNIEKTLFKFVMDSNITKAKSLLNDMTIPKNNKDLGKYIAVKGIISMLNNRNKVNGIVQDIAKMSRLRKILLKRTESIWSDEFEKGYFETWISFINYSKRYLSNYSSTEKSINQNPSEQKKENEAS
jgi:hypothetical protein